MKLYCPTCGAGTNYSLNKPKFCASCGESFTVSGKTTPRRVISRVEKASTKVPQMIEEEEEELFEVPDVDKLQYDLHESRGFNVVKLEHLAGTSEGGNEDGYVREADPTYGAESFEKDFMRDAGSSRRADAET